MPKIETFDNQQATADFDLQTLWNSKIFIAISLNEKHLDRNK